MEIGNIENLPIASSIEDFFQPKSEQNPLILLTGNSRFLAFACFSKHPSNQWILYFFKIFYKGLFD